jgi:serine protease Do
MSTRRSTLFYGLLIVVASIMVGMVIASRLDLSTPSMAQTIAAPPANGAPLSGPVDATTFRAIAKTASPAVVNIRTESRQRADELRNFFGGDNPFERFLQPDADEPEETIVPASGTGFIIDKSGLILTNNHVVEGTSMIKVSLYGEDRDQEYSARVVGRDSLTDSALIALTEKVDHALPVVRFGNSDQMQAGDWVMAIGNPFGLAHTVSVGVVSGIGRGAGDIPGADARGPRFIQTDAAINPGNSGGPLLNLRGEVIGINTAIFSDARQQGNIGIGFAVPINTVRDLLPQLQAGKVTRGRIGVVVKDIRREEFGNLGLKTRDGAIVSEVVPKSSAARAGMLAGDVLLTFNGVPVKRSDDLVQMVTATKPGATVPARIMRLRNGEERTISLTVDELNFDTERGGRPSSREPSREDSSVKPERNKDFGLQLGPVTVEYDRQLRLNGQKGGLVYKVDDGSPARNAGVRPGDLIIRVGRKTVGSHNEAADELGKVQSGGTALIWVVRQRPQGERDLGGEETFLTLTKD